MKRSVLFILIGFHLALLSSCNVSHTLNESNGNEPTTKLTAQDLGYDPVARWSERGDYSYNIKLTQNGLTCQTEQKFGNKADYCLGLQSQDRNNGCALSLRMQKYNNECGNDFQEIEFRNYFWRSGYDPQLKVRCETGRAEELPFKTLKHLCRFLKDEKLHKNCFWSDRLGNFRNLGCLEDFSPEPGEQNISLWE